MSLKLKVKVGQVTNLSDARYCAGMGVALLGFPVGTGGLDAATYRQIIDWVSGPELVLELAHASDLDNVKGGYPGHFIQIAANHLELLNDKTLQFIVSINAKEWPSLAPQLKAHQNIQYIDVEAAPDELGIVKQINQSFPVLLQMNNIDDLDEVIAAGITGLSLKGGDEVRPGLRDYGDLAAVLEKLED